MGKTRDIFKKTGDTKGILHAKIGTREDKNGKNLTEAEEIKERWQEYPEYLYRKALNDPDNHSGVVNHLEPDILKCEVKWALGSLTKNKAIGCGVIPAAAAASRFSHVRLCATPWTVAYQASPSMEFSRQKHWSGLLFPSAMQEIGK